MSYPAIKVLDHGYLKLIEDWGYGEAGIPEASIIEAARQSLAHLDSLKEPSAARASTRTACVPGASAVRGV